MTDPEPLPIDPSESMATQSRHALMVAEQKLDLLTFRWPVDMRDKAQVQRLRDELGPDAELPQDDGVYYLVYLTTESDSRMPVLIPEGDPRSFVFALAAKRGKTAAMRVLYRRGMLPR